MRGKESKLIFITPSEAQRHLKQLWRVEGALLGQIFESLTAGHFFQQVVAVPPNRFRPPSTVGDGVFEHPCNILLSRVLAQDMELRRQLSGEPRYVNASNAGQPNAPPDTERVLRAWEDEANHRGERRAAGVRSSRGYWRRMRRTSGELLGACG